MSPLNRMSESHFVKVVAWVVMLLCALAMLVLMAQMIVLALGLPALERQNPGSIDIGLRIAPYIVFFFFLLTVVHLSVAVGLIRQAEWARRAFVVLGFFWSILFIAQMPIHLYWTFDAFKKAGISFYCAHVVFEFCLALAVGVIGVACTTIARKMMRIHFPH